MPRKKMMPDISGVAGLKDKESKALPTRQVGSVKTRMPTAMKQAGRGNK